MGLRSASNPGVTCTLTFEIGSDELIPIQNLELTVTGRDVRWETIRINEDGRSPPDK